ncbi:MAG: undecaprenyl/decaprenyl-phosphate alpha-N-acetylglucosaminyl 1-phosphate transferase [Bryobacterales bacterium]|nr:undecaprenyl/decaprenyl-phosphate alpha-N-acetylglucosaminyl 1-phosphate transferase [Bryobacterales bacterium]
MLSIMLLGAVSFLLALASTPLIRTWSERAGLVDHPDGNRKIHSRPVSRVGGIAILLAILGACLVLLVSQLDGGEIIRSWAPSMLRLLPAVVVMFATGLIDDIYGLKPWQKLLGQLAAVGLAVTLGGVMISGVRGYSLPVWFSYGVTLVWLIGCTNAVNLIDGVDGLASGVGLFAAATTLIAALLHGDTGLALATAPLAGALLGFLRYNSNPASIFLGDCGSLPIGFLLGIFAVEWGQKSATLLGMTAPLMALAIPLLDTGLSIVRRFLRQQPIFGADRGHIHHRLLAQGLTPRRVTLVLYGVCGMGAALALLGSFWQGYTGPVLVTFCAVSLAGIRRLGYVEFGVAGRLLSGGTLRLLLNRQLSLANFAAELQAASTPEACWSAILHNYRSFGFAVVHASLQGQTFHDGDQPAGHELWKLSIPLAGGDSIELYREPGSSLCPTGAGAFAELAGQLVEQRLDRFSASACFRHQRPAAKLELGLGTPHSPLSEAPPV